MYVWIHTRVCMLYMWLVWHVLKNFLIKLVPDLDQKGQAQGAKPPEAPGFSLSVFWGRGKRFNLHGYFNLNVSLGCSFN